MLRCENDSAPVGGRHSRMISIYASGMHGRFRISYGTQYIHVAAAMAEDRAVIDDMVAHGADPDARDAGGCTPLHYAASSNPVGEVSAALFEAGADPEACAAANDPFIDAALGR